MEKNIAANPLNVSFFRAIGIVFETNGLTDLVEQFFWRRLQGMH